MIRLKDLERIAVLPSTYETLAWLEDDFGMRYQGLKVPKGMGEPTKSRPKPWKLLGVR